MPVSSSARSSRPADAPRAASSKAQAAGAKTTKAQPGKTQPGKTQAAKKQPSKTQPAGKPKAAPATAVEPAAAAEDETGGELPARPLPVTVAAAMTGLIGAVLVTYGIFLVIGGFTGQPVTRGRAELAGVIFLVFGLGIAWAARGLGHLQPWARTPALLTQLMLLGVAYWLRQGGMTLGAAAALVVGLGGAVLLFLPSSHRVLSRDVR